LSAIGAQASSMVDPQTVQTVQKHAVAAKDLAKDNIVSAVNTIGDTTLSAKQGIQQSALGLKAQELGQDFKDLKNDILTRPGQPLEMSPQTELNATSTPEGVTSETPTTSKLKMSANESIDTAKEKAAHIVNTLRYGAETADSWEKK